ncbi:MAG: hypothetical protein IJV13_02810 [Prevotella sp.]|nr:hypothetical protein [Prevotella sp.]
MADFVNLHLRFRIVYDRVEASYPAKFLKKAAPGQADNASHYVEYMDWYRPRK